MGSGRSAEGKRWKTVDGNESEPWVVIEGLGFFQAREDVGFGYAGADLRMAKFRWRLVFVVEWSLVWLEFGAGFSD